MMGTFSVNFTPNSKWNFSWDNFLYRNREREYYTITSAYALSTTDPVTGTPVVSYDIGGQIDHARNDLLATVYGSQLTGQFSFNANTKIEFGAKIETEKLQDLTNEWQHINYRGYNWSLGGNPFGILSNPFPLNLNYSIGRNNHLKTNRYSGFIQ